MENRKQNGKKTRAEYFQIKRILARKRIATGVKVCRKCGESKSLDEFYNVRAPGKAGLDGKRGSCKACEKAAGKLSGGQQHE
jgi:hypothetical protein